MSDESVDWLPTYLRDHYAGATGGLQFFGRVASGHSDAGVRDEVARMRGEVADDRDQLAAVMDTLGIRQASVTMVAATLGEYAGRLKPNGSLLKRSPGTDVIEVEALSIAVQGRTRVWQTLIQLAENGDTRLDASRMQPLLDRAHEHRDTLNQLHERVLRTLSTG